MNLIMNMSLHLRQLVFTAVFTSSYIRAADYTSAVDDSGAAGYIRAVSR